MKLSRDTFLTVKSIIDQHSAAEAELQKRNAQKSRRDLHRTQLLRLIGRDLELSREDLELTVKEVRDSFYLLHAFTSSSLRVWQIQQFEAKYQEREMEVKLQLAEVGTRTQQAKVYFLVSIAVADSRNADWIQTQIEEIELKKESPVLSGTDDLSQESYSLNLDFEV